MLVNRRGEKVFPLIVQGYSPNSAGFSWKKRKLPIDPEKVNNRRVYRKTF
ncbi:hypothetical protein CHELA17_64864 [Chelatococcus asaccharovorans]|nr:hypothetical protein CHELA17_64864 [Chelatococcus asaccharovorans]